MQLTCLNNLATIKCLFVCHVLVYFLLNFFFEGNRVSGTNRYKEKEGKYSLILTRKGKVTLSMIRPEWANIWTAVGKFDPHNVH